MSVEFHASKPCRNCGDRLRYSKGGCCVTCRKRRAAKHYEKVKAARIAARIVTPLTTV